MLDNAPTYVVFFETAKSLTAQGGLAPTVAGVAETPAGGRQPGGGLHGRDDLHRQRAELHGQGDRREVGRRRCRASSATCVYSFLILLPLFAYVDHTLDCSSDEWTSLNRLACTTKTSPPTAACGSIAGELADCPSIAFDTEFVSEHTYRPVLCLVQVAADGATGRDRRDDHRGHDALLGGDRRAGARDDRPRRPQRDGVLPARSAAAGRLFDVQIAAGLVGIEYPAGYGTLISQLLGEAAKKHETRTDWRRRPLSQRQIEYALDDVRYLQPLRDALHARLGELGRLGWLAEEMRRLAGRGPARGRARTLAARVGQFGPRRPRLAIVRELWQWREAEAQRRDSRVRRVLRDDLIVELAKRQTADPKRIDAVRGLERGDLQRVDRDCRARSSGRWTCPRTNAPTRPARTDAAAFGARPVPLRGLGSICRQAQLRPNLVGSPNDIRELDRLPHRARSRARPPPPQLARGWRPSSSAGCSTTCWPASRHPHRRPRLGAPAGLGALDSWILEVAERSSSQGESGVRRQEPGGRRREGGKAEDKEAGDRRQEAGEREKGGTEAVAYGRTPVRCGGLSRAGSH